MAENVSSEMDAAIRNLFAVSLKSDKSVVALVCDETNYGIALGGNTNDMMTVFASVLRDGKAKANMNPSKSILYEMLLDAVSVAFTPDELIKEMDGRVNKYIP